MVGKKNGRKRKLKESNTDLIENERKKEKEIKKTKDRKNKWKVEIRYFLLFGS